MEDKQAVQRMKTSTVSKSKRVNENAKFIGIIMNTINSSIVYIASTCIYTDEGRGMAKKSAKKSAKIINTRRRPKMHRYQVYMPMFYWNAIVKVADEREVTLSEIYRNIMEVGYEKLELKVTEREVGSPDIKFHRFQVYITEKLFGEIQDLSLKSKLRPRQTTAEVFRQIMETGFKELGIKLKQK